ncbi:hypothetical protein Pint_12274 [Pistacia integerrima]|uniref:Uncharacterized protein n=1 Tax=Pistacia integerrima TaxID=434235 RepID=A0ACC0XJU4_9ROSI|nr:hypothetical protein Pint_12274 [Pistacia integerrima]
MATDQVTVDIPPQMDELHEIENEHVTSPEEHNVMDTRTTLPKQSSHEEIIEIMTSPPQDEAEIVELKASPPHEDPAADNPTRIDELYKAACEILYEAARSNDWKKAYEEVFKKDPVKNSEYLTARVTDNGDTALHVAVATKSFAFGEKLIKHMKGEDLEAKNTDGNTAFFLIVASDNVRLVKQMWEKNKKLPSIRGANEMLPINMAAQSGHEKVVKFLCENFLSMSQKDKYLNEEDHLKLIHSLIRIDKYGKHALLLIFGLVKNIS